MRKLLSRFFVLAVLLGCLSLFSTMNSQAKAIPPCPENCHADCHALENACIAGCPSEACVNKCIAKYASCFAYCDWVCGPE